MQNRKTAQRQTVRELLQRAQANNQTGARFLRNRGTSRSGRPFSGLEKATVWLSAAVIPGKDSRLWRQDLCGAHMYWPDYGNTSSSYGWEVDHIIPVGKGGSDLLGNLQALHWQNNRYKGNSIGTNYCVIRTGS